MVEAIGYEPGTETENIPINEGLFWQIVDEYSPIMDVTNLELLRHLFKDWFKRYESEGRPEKMRTEAVNILETMESGAKKNREKNVYYTLSKVIDPVSDKLELI